MKKNTLSFLIGVLVLFGSFYLCAAERVLYVFNNSHNYYISRCIQAYPIHGAWDTTISQDTNYQYGSEIIVKMHSQGNGIRGWLFTSVWDNASGQLAGYLAFEINNYMTHVSSVTVGSFWGQAPLDINYMSNDNTTSQISIE